MDTLHSVCAAILVCTLGLIGSAAAQQTIFNMPSADVLEKGKVYGEVDVAFKTSDSSAGFVPRIVVGVGRRIEVGINVNGIGTQAAPQTTLTPTIKWKAYDGSSNGWAFLVGDDLFVPVQNRAYDAGNYVYAQFAKTFRTKTRVTFGAYHFTRNVVAAANRAGGQFAAEQPIGSRVTLAADWYTGGHALGFFAPGVIIKLTPKLIWYGTYQLGNRSTPNGNHLFLTEFGWSFN